MPDWIQRIRAAEQRNAALEARMAEPRVAVNPSELAKLGKEAAGLRPLLEVGRRYLELQERLGEAAALQKDDDPELRALAQEEKAELEKLCGSLEAELRPLFMPRDPNDERNVILEIRAGTGGEEAALFAADLLRMYTRYAEAQGWKVDPISMHATDVGGLKGVFIDIEGAGAYGRLKYEGGVHRVQRVPVTESQGRVHTSTATVAVMPVAEKIEIEIPPDELRIDVFRASGPGGQSVNTTDSAVRITHLPTGMVVTCQDEKSQHKNRARAEKVLRAQLLEKKNREQQQQRADQRRSQVGWGKRSEKFRTYNYPQNRITDHRAGVSVHQLDRLVEGELDILLEGIHTWAARQWEQDEAEAAPPGAARGEGAAPAGDDLRAAEGRP